MNKGFPIHGKEKAMKTMTCSIALLVLMLSGCQAQFADQYRVGIDPAFQDDYQSEILLAVEEWQTAIGPQQLTLTYTLASCDSSDGDRLICFHPGSDEWFAQNDPSGHIGVTMGMQSASASSNIYLKLSALNDVGLRHQTTLHEMGHALGLMHTTEYAPEIKGKHIMDPNAGSASLFITCEDVKQYFSYRSNVGFVQGDKCEDPHAPLDTHITPQVGAWD